MRLRSVSKTDALYEEVSIHSSITEVDGSFPPDCFIQLPGFTASPADGPGRMPGLSISVGQQAWNLHRKVVCSSGDEFEVTLHLAIRGS